MNEGVHGWEGAISPFVASRSKRESVLYPCVTTPVGIPCVIGEMGNCWIQGCGWGVSFEQPIVNRRPEIKYHLDHD